MKISYLKNVRTLVVTISTALLANTPAVFAQALPANPNTNARASAILDFYTNLPSQPGARVLSGQWAGYGPYANITDLQTIYNQTGHWPALIGVNYADFTTNGISTTNANNIAISYWNNHGFVDVDVHFLTNPLGGGLRDTNVDLIRCITPGTPEYTNWMQTLDQVAAGLQALQTAGVPVIWRPFHEMNGAWFWWGGKPPADFIQVWQHMFNYFTSTKHLNNLLWCFSPNAGANPAAYYPGAAYVDMVGLDAYYDTVDQSTIHGYPAMVALGKPFVFGEFGPLTSGGSWDYAQLIAGIQANFPLTTGFMCWNGNWSPAANPNATGLFNDPLIINRDTLPQYFWTIP